MTNNVYHHQILHSITEIDSKEWQTFINQEDDLAMDQRLLAVLEDTLADQAKFWTVIFRDEQNNIIACAVLALFETDVTQSASRWVQNAVSYLRLRWSNFLKWRILFCGLPMPAGCSHFRVASHVDSEQILPILNAVMQKLAKQHNAQMLVLKECMQEELDHNASLYKLGFYRGELRPLYVLSGYFENYAHYLDCMRKKPRRSVRLNEKKFAAGNFEIACMQDSKEIVELFTDEVYQLYLNVHARAKEKLECLPKKFFQNLALNMPGQIVFVLIRRHQQPVAFAYGLIGSQYFHCLYCGVDYTLNKEFDLYFNLQYQELAIAFSYGKAHISMGQTSDSFKTRLGAQPHRRFFFVRALHPILRVLFFGFRSFIFPAIRLDEELHVFKK